MKKYFYNFYLILINIGKYGLYEIFKAFFIEFMYLIKIRDFKSWLYDDKYTDSYKYTKSDNDYNAPQTPTPYYFLNIAAKFLRQNKINNFVLCDFGCGHGRLGKFFKDKFNCLFYGMEINKFMIEDLKKENEDNFFLFAIDLKNKVERQEIFNKIKEHKKTIVLFISDTFDIRTINEILDYFSNTVHYVIAVNIKESDKLPSNYEVLSVKEFNIKNRHVILLKKN